MRKEAFPPHRPTSEGWVGGIPNSYFLIPDSSQLDAR
jgi:hypothetical protein